jgi:hypothetical protein
MSQRARLHIVVEGRTDAQIIRAIVGKDLAGSLRFFASGGRTSLATMGRNILVHEGGPVLVVMDADTTNQRLVDDQKSLTYLAMSGVAPTGYSGLSDRVKVFAFVPEIEVIFFEVPQVLESILGKPVSEEQVQEGVLTPKTALAKILGASQVLTLAAGLTPQAAELLASGQQAQSLKETIGSMMATAVNV